MFLCQHHSFIIPYCCLDCITEDNRYDPFQVWCLLLFASYLNGSSPLGDDHFTQLLSTPMFQPVGRGCYVQVLFILIDYIPFIIMRNLIISELQISGCPVSRLLYGCPLGEKITSYIPGATPIPRNRIFYHAKKCDSPTERVNLPASHVLRCKVSHFFDHYLFYNSLMICTGETK